MSVPRSAPARKSDNCTTGAVRALLEDRRRVRGRRVKRGQKIAHVGWVNHEPVDPLKYVMPDAIVD